MLVLSRRKGEAITIDYKTRVIYLGQNEYGQAKFGIEAPIEVKVHREEVSNRIVQENKKRPKEPL